MKHLFTILLFSFTGVQAQKENSDYDIVGLREKPVPVSYGEYTLKIVTRYSNGSTLLKSARSIVYELPLKVGMPDDQS